MLNGSFIGCNFKDYFADFDKVTFFLTPFCYSSFFHRGRELWHRQGKRHMYPVYRSFYFKLRDSKTAATIFSTVGIVSRSSVLEYGIGVSPCETRLIGA